MIEQRSDFFAQGGSDRNLRLMILQAPVAMCILNGPDYIIEIANNKIIELWGKTAADVVNRPVFEALPEVRDQGLETLLHDVMRTGITFTASERPVDLPRNGQLTTFYIDFSYQPIFDENGSVTGIMVVAIDMTQQVLSRKKIQESEARARSLIESAPFPIGVYTGENMEIAMTNQAILDAWGRGQEVIGQTFQQALPELNPRFFGQLQKVYRSGQPHHARNQRVDIQIDGIIQPFYFNYSYTPLFDADGSVYGVMNTAADVTDLTVAKQQLEQSEQNFRNMILQSPVAMCILIGPDHIVDIANDAMITLWGKPKQTVMNKPIFEALPDAREQGLEVIMRDVYETGKRFTASERPVELLRNGRIETVYQNFTYEPYRDTADNIVGILAISVDVSQQVMARQMIEEVVVDRTRQLAELNKALTHNNEALLRSNKNLEQFAYAASHDLKEPLRKIHFFSNRLSDQIADRLTENEHRYFDRMQDAARRMTQLVDDLLNYSQTSQGVDSLKPVKLNDTLQLVLRDLELLVEEQQAIVTIEELPTVQGSPRQLQQLFQNIISNAIKYNQPGQKPVIEISAGVINEADLPPALNHDGVQRFHHLIVKDNGIGFAQDDAEKIFHVFTRLHGTGAYKGTGVGLAIARRVMDNHLGHIWATSAPGEGASFHLLFPFE